MIRRQFESQDFASLSYGDCARSTPPPQASTRKAEWTEVLDLAIDPCELKNLTADTAAMAELGAEFDAQTKAVKHAVPADKPPPSRQGKK